MCEIYDNSQPFAACWFITFGTFAGVDEPTGRRGDWTRHQFNLTAAPQGGLSGRVLMIEKKDQSVKARTEKQVSERSMDVPQDNKVNPSTKAPPVQDRWFDTQLSRMYADLAADPVPKDMMALLDKLKAKKSQ